MKYGSKQELIARIRTEYDAFQRLLTAIPRDRYREQYVWGDGWTVLDLVAHLSAWHSMFLSWYHEGLTGGVPAMPAPGYKWNETPRLNREIWRENHNRSVEDVLDEFARSHSEIVDLVESLPVDALLQPGHFKWTGRHPLTTYLGPNTVSHYRFASKVLRRWQKRQSVEAGG